MKVVEIIGGLGNQMFQYAFYLSLREKYGSENVALYLDRFKEVKDNNGYELERIFKIKESMISNEKVKKYIDREQNIFSKIRRKIFGVKKSYINEGEDFLYKENVYRAEKKEEILFYSGLWQSSKYFEGIEDIVRNKFEFPKIDGRDIKNNEVLIKIKNSNSVSIHIRRGDYYSNPKYKRILGNICDKNYYENAIKIISKKIENPIFFIFSDEINWVKENINFNNKEIYFIEWNKGFESYKDMYLMSQCKNNIIANSTFSWWVAWLNKNPDKIVIAPNKWFNDYKKIDIVSEGWVKL
ncbi:alpha-1,2-fucosyltransferase [Haliovirga abyssi]|uniref:Alpha-1,2-fucosyltransferase n=1 Tax=Haliovirga abyssi TaxID=2996794 RepID=A0AAU9DS36_9FUSO|nr:alpha-1,2-fucosyltransferase [Haliovirga abyssi]BDU51418.1 alpha-1,2-fucosyltransferase [Haliovirga abyssi]